MSIICFIPLLRLQVVGYLPSYSAPYRMLPFLTPRLGGYVVSTLNSCDTTLSSSVFYGA